MVVKKDNYPPETTIFYFSQKADKNYTEILRNCWGFQNCFYGLLIGEKLWSWEQQFGYFSLLNSKILILSLTVKIFGTNG